MGLFHEKQKSSFNDEKQSFEDGRPSFMTSWHVFLSDSNIFVQEIFSLDKFWFRGATQNIFKPLVWHLLHQNILVINDFMNVYEKLIIFIKSLIFNIFWWKKCLTIGLEVFWVDPRNQIGLVKSVFRFCNSHKNDKICSHFHAPTDTWGNVWLIQRLVATHQFPAHKCSSFSGGGGYSW